MTADFVLVDAIITKNGTKRKWTGFSSFSVKEKDTSFSYVVAQHSISQEQLHLRKYITRCSLKKSR